MYYSADSRKILTDCTLRTWAEIDLDAIEQNLEAIRAAADGAAIIAVVKADAYGHGAAQISLFLASLGVTHFAVACVSEALELRDAGITGEIIILGHTPPELVHELSAYSLTASVCDLECAAALSAAAHGAETDINVHAKADTGMSRLGVACRNDGDIAAATDEIMEISRLPHLRLRGLFTHFAVSDEPDRAFTNAQGALFRGLVAELAQRGLTLPLVHACNSAGLAYFPELHGSGVRPGIILYGYPPDSEENSAFTSAMKLSPSMTFKTRVAQVKTVPAGTRIGYGLTFSTDAERRIAVLSVGYADGYLRRYGADYGEVSICGKPAKIVGRVCMDMCMADVTDIEGVRAGDEAILFGAGGPNLEALACAAGTINYEITCNIAKRVPRVYLHGGKR